MCSGPLSMTADHPPTVETADWMRCVTAVLAVLVALVTLVLLLALVLLVLPVLLVRLALLALCVTWSKVEKRPQGHIEGGKALEEKALPGREPPLQLGAPEHVLLANLSHAYFRFTGVGALLTVGHQAVYPTRWTVACSRELSLKLFQMLQLPRHQSASVSVWLCDQERIAHGVSMLRRQRRAPGTGP